LPACGTVSGAKQPVAKRGLPVMPLAEKKLAGKVVPLVLLMPNAGWMPVDE
jgi:hypothetical protein